MNGSNLTHQNTFSNPRGTGYSIGGVRKTTLRYDAASGRLVGMSAGSDNFAWEYLAGTNLKSKLTYPNAATAEWTYEAERDLISRVKNTVNGNVISQYDYAPFGAVTASGDVSQPFQWSSEVYDSELDLVYYNFRHYSPSLGRFLSRDPIAEQGGLNLYAFVGNSVLLKFDYCGNMISKISGEYSSLTPIFSAEDSVFPMGEMARVKVEDKTRLRIDVLKSAWFTFSNHTYILKSEGSLTLSLIWRREKKALFDDKKSSLNVHEKKHFEDYKKIYNEMIEEFNSYDEKTLCAKKVPCRQEVREYSQALRSFYLLKADFAAAVFHSTAESGYSDEMRNAELALKRRQDLPSTIKNYGDYVVYLQNRIMADATNVEELKKSLDKCINENQ